MTTDLLRRALLTRRAWIAAAGAGAAAASLRTERRAGESGDPDDIAAAARLLDLQLEDDEITQVAGRLSRHRRQLNQVRGHEVARGTPPALRFDPWGPTPPPPGAGAGARFQPPATLPDATDDQAVAFASVHELAAMLRSGSTTSRQLTELALRRLRKHDPVLHCTITLLEDHALALADAADREIARGAWRGPLHGIPFGAKDLLSHPGAPTTFGARPFAEQVLDEEATVLRRLRDAGAVLVAKLSLGALAMGDVWFGGRTRNPWNLEQGSSGSSAGSAAAVAAGLVPFAIGSETLGSIVSPCSRCGATGLRPTFGAVSRHGAMPLSWTMDKLGPIARTAADCALVFDVIRGADGLDPDAIDAPFAWQPDRPPGELRIAYLEDPQWERPEFTSFLQTLGAADGVELTPLQLPDYPYRSILMVLAAEAATAFDDLTRRGGLRDLVSQGPGDWPNLMRTARFVPAVEYLRAMRIRTRLIEDVRAALREIDAFVCPPFGNAALACTNLTGHPGCVLPLSARENGTPTSITIYGRLWGEAAVLAVAEHWQRKTDWHRRRPPLE